MEFECEIKLVDFGALRALVSVRIGPMTIRGFKVIDAGEGKTWVAPPTREVVRKGNKEYYEIVRFENEEAKRLVSDRILEEYVRVLQGQAHGEAGAAQGGKGA